MRRLVRRLCILIVLVAATSVDLVGAGGVRAAERMTLETGDVAEAWYTSASEPACTSPVGCPPQVTTAPLYPADTLHVGASGTQETERSYVVPDLSVIPTGAVLYEATMRLPVDGSSGSGTQNPSAAMLKACLVTAKVTDGVAGQLTDSPSFDCATSQPAVYQAASNSVTLDLTAFLTVWRSGRALNGIVLLADNSQTATPPMPWQLTIQGRHRAGVPHISTSITFEAPEQAGTDTSSTGSPAGGDTALTPAVLPTAATIPPLTQTQAPEQPEGVAPQVAPAATGQIPAASTTDQPAPRFQYPLAFLVPVGLVVGFLYFNRLFTKEISPMALRQPVQAHGGRK